MLFTSPGFLFAFLPAFLGLYFAAPSGSKNLVLLLASLFFYFTTSGELTTVLILSIAVNWALAVQMHAVSLANSRLFLAAGIAVNLLPLLYYKYARFLLLTLHDAAETLGVGFSPPELHPILPIGISFFTFQAISYLADVHMRRVSPARSLIDFGMYHSCFPQLIAGPIVRYEQIEPEVHRRTHTLSALHDGIVQFCFGLAKKAILADPIGQLADKAFSLPPSQLTSGAAWLGILAYSLQIYTDFSGYSDMAIGLGRMLGFPYPENFDQPYRSRSVTEFWRRWHMTLSSWFKDYLYIPLGGNRAPLPRVLLNLAVVFVFCGLWHGAANTFIAWGLYHGVLLIAERLLRRFFPRNAPQGARLPALLGWAYTTLAVMAGWVLFRADTFPAALTYLAAMFRPGTLQLPPALATIITPDKLTYLAAAIAVSLVPYRPFLTFTAHRYTFGPASAAFSLLLAGLAIILLSVGSFTPFIYFRF